MRKIFIFMLFAVWAFGNALSAKTPLLLDTLYVDATRHTVPGKYVWIPDTLVNDVKDVLDGYSQITEKIPEPENDLVRVGNDTISQVLKDRNYGRFDRGLYNYLFIPKGKWQAGITASYGKLSSEDLKLLDMVSDLDLDITAYSVNPYISYFIRNNMSVGLRFGYTNAKAGIHSLDVNIDDDLDFSLEDVNYNNETYSAALFLRQFYGLSRAGRFGVFNEMELSFGSGNADFVRSYDSKPRATHSTYMTAKLTFSPGLCVFIMDNVSFNISFGVFGFHLRNEKQRTTMLNPADREETPDETGSRFTSGANFRFNIFNINFGLGIHI
ncbi:MAG: hypothetical protein NC402_02660 [Prevotella sp.]|nr:hypothetical protein [Prevotella sp.]MCM1074830.1 hypothetical protein [Ruminococcus sp.]